MAFAWTTTKRLFGVRAASWFAKTGSMSARTIFSKQSYSWSFWPMTEPTPPMPMTIAFAIRREFFERVALGMPHGKRRRGSMFPQKGF